MTHDIAASPEASLAATMAQFDASQLAHQTLSTTAMAQNKDTLFAAMRAAGITEIIVTFDGAGDSGQIEDIDAHRGDAVVPMPDTEIMLAQVSWGISEISTSSMSLSEAVETRAPRRSPLRRRATTSSWRLLLPSRPMASHRP